jgi:hypothetical protein
MNSEHKMLLLNLRENMNRKRSIIIVSKWIKDLFIIVMDINKKEISNSPFPNRQALSDFLGISLSTVGVYIRSGKLFNNKYYFFYRNKINK